MDIIEHLETYGYAIEQNVIPVDECEEMAKALDEIKTKKQKAGTIYSTESQTVLFNVHLEEPDIFLNKIDIPQVMDVASKVLKDEYILSNFNGSLSGTKGGNRIHIDSRIPITDFASTFQIAVLLCIDDFTSKNGATIVWPFSHNSGRDPRYIRDKTVIEGGIQACAPKGSIVYTLGQTWHDVGPNLDGTRRWGIIAYYSRWWIKPTFDFTQCGPQIYSRLTNRQKNLMGFTSRPPANGEKRSNTLIPVESLPQKYDEALSL